MNEHDEPMSTCWACDGAGCDRRSNEVCPWCEGKGLLPTRETGVHPHDVQDKPGSRVRGKSTSSRPPSQVQELAAVATPKPIPVFDPVKLPRRDGGRLDFPRWSCDHQACIEVLNEHSNDLGKVAGSCQALGLDAADTVDMLDAWSWTWICSTLVWLRALRGDPAAANRCVTR